MSARSALACIVVISAASCEPKSLRDLYCEGGVIDGKASGGECLSLSFVKPDTDLDTVGTAVLESRYAERFTVRRAGKSSYTLLLAGKRVGSIEQNGYFINVRFDDTKKSFAMRSDAPGALI